MAGNGLTRDAVWSAAYDAMIGPWIWGQSDCCAAACAAHAALTGVDPLRDLRGTYTTEIGAGRIIRRAGGFAPLVAGFLTDAGLIPADPAPGALGIVRGVDGSELMAICLHPGAWVAKTRKGMAAVNTYEGCWTCPR